MRLSKGLKKLVFVCCIFCGLLVFRQFFFSQVKAIPPASVFSNQQIDNFPSELPANFLESKSIECPAGVQVLKSFWGQMCWDDSRHLFTTPRGEAFIWTYVEDTSHSFDSVREAHASIECNNAGLLRLVVLNDSTAHSIPNVKHDFALLTSRHKAIYIRQLVLHEFGGVYVEQHVVAFRAMDSLLAKLSAHDLVQLHTASGCVLGMGPARAQTQLTHAWVTAIEQLVDSHHDALVRANTAGAVYPIAPDALDEAIWKSAILPLESANKAKIFRHTQEWAPLKSNADRFCTRFEARDQAEWDRYMKEPYHFVSSELFSFAHYIDSNPHLMPGWVSAGVDRSSDLPSELLRLSFLTCRTRLNAESDAAAAPVPAGELVIGGNNYYLHPWNLPMHVDWIRRYMTSFSDRHKL